MTERTAAVLARDGNIAVVQLPGRHFPGLCIQGDTFLDFSVQTLRAEDRTIPFATDDR